MHPGTFLRLVEGTGTSRSPLNFPKESFSFPDIQRNSWSLLKKPTDYKELLELLSRKFYRLLGTHTAS
jgi:hypothetical protein